MSAGTGNDPGNDPFLHFDDVTDRLLEETAQQIRAADSLLANLAEKQTELLAALGSLTRAVGRLEAERNAWRLRAEEMERERNLWRSKAEEMEAKYRTAATRAAELALWAGETACPQCGSLQVVLIRGDFPTGVDAPDGALEMRYECAIDCQACGHKEELVP